DQQKLRFHRSRAGNAALRLSIAHLDGWVEAEGDTDERFDRDGIAVLHRRAEFPLLQSFPCGLVEALVDAANEAQLREKSVLGDDRVEHDDALDLLANRTGDVLGIDFDDRER